MPMRAGTKPRSPSPWTDGHGVQAIGRRDSLADGGVVLDDPVPTIRVAQVLIGHDSDGRLPDGRIAVGEPFHFPQLGVPTSTNGSYTDGLDRSSGSCRLGSFTRD